METGSEHAPGDRPSIALKPAPILKVIGVTVAVAVAIVLINQAFESIRMDERIEDDASWILAIMVHVPQFVIPFLLIVLATRGRIGEFGFTTRANPPFTHKSMLGLGLPFGLLMSIRYIGPLIDGSPLDTPRPIRISTVLGNLAFQWIVVGLSEETMFRGFIQTYLMKSLEGHLKMLGHEFHIGTILGAVIWGLFHLINILIMPWNTVLFYVFLTTAARLAMGYVYQESGSLLSTIIVHNSLFGVPLTIGYILEWLL
jgi:membrane protease YdiL (CAAX protease family)